MLFSFRGERKMENDIVVLGQMDNSQDHTFESANRVSCGGGGIQPKILDIVAMRGRDPENPSDRTVGNPNLEQRLEINEHGIANTLTTVSKDNMVLERTIICDDLYADREPGFYEETCPTLSGERNGLKTINIRQATKEGSIPCEVGGVADLDYPNSTTRRGRVINNGKVSPTITTSNLPSVIEDWTWMIDDVIYQIRIRKLTERESWRLMGFSDVDFEAAAQHNSKTQLYKQAGNSIVKDVLMSLFSAMYEQLPLMKKPIKLIELFAGVGAQAMALRDCKIDFEHHKVVEFDKYAIASYNAIHHTNYPTIDINDFSGEDLEINNTEDFTYLLTYSFPCTDISLAGRQEGMSEGSGTRSSLLWQVKRLLIETEKLPQILVMENVPQVHSKKNIKDFQKWIDFLELIGYKNFLQDLNAKDYNVAQSRNRAFMVSVLDDCVFSFPTKIGLNKCIKDYLEENVDEKYYLTSDKARDLIDKLVIGGTLKEKVTTVKMRGLSSDKMEASAEPINVACTLCARDWKGPNNFGFNGVVEIKE